MMSARPPLALVVALACLRVHAQDAPASEPAPADLAAPAAAEPPAAPLSTTSTAPPPSDSPAVSESPSPESDNAPARGTSAASSNAIPDNALDELLAEIHLGEPVPLVQREATLKQWNVEIDGKGGLVGTSPARFSVDVRLGLLPWLELRTGLAPYPDGLMARVRLGSVHDSLGAFVLDAGLAHLDLGIRLAGDPDEDAPFGVRAHVESGLAWERTIDDVRLSLMGRYRHRFSTLSDDEQQIVAGAASVSANLTPYLAVTGGAAFSSTLFDTTVKEPSVVLVAWDRPFFSTLLARDEGSDTSVELPLAFTLSRTESFDMDVFSSVRVYPEPGFLVGAGLRLRFGPS